MRKLTYSLAINEAFHQVMASDPSVFLIGQGVKSPWYVGNTAQGLLEKFGDTRVIDTPVSENAMTGAAVGAALTGMRPVVVHPRMQTESGDTILVFITQIGRRAEMPIWFAIPSLR